MKSDAVHECTHKQRMLNAYKGIRSDFIPIAPEFWFYYPAKILGMSMMDLHLDMPHWKALQETFAHFGCEGWGIVEAARANPEVKKTSSLIRLDEDNYRMKDAICFQGKQFTYTTRYNRSEPCWMETFPVEDVLDVDAYMHYAFSDKVSYDFNPALEGYTAVGDDYLLEYNLGVPFFDQFAFAMGFEKALYYILEQDESVLMEHHARFMQFQEEHLLEAIRKTPFEAFFIGCGYSCVSLIGPDLWRRWDKPYIKRMAEILHRHGRYLHVHFHGKCMEVLDDFAEIGIDCVCPFERAPGDINGLEGLLHTRSRIGDSVTFNGNVHTVEALEREDATIVRQQVKEIKKAFKGSTRLIIGTGDQVSGRTPEENIRMMILEGRRDETF